MLRRFSFTAARLLYMSLERETSISDSLHVFEQNFLSAAVIEFRGLAVGRVRRALVYVRPFAELDDSAAPPLDGRQCGLRKALQNGALPNLSIMSIRVREERYISLSLLDHLIFTGRGHHRCHRQYRQNCVGPQTRTLHQNQKISFFPIS